MRNFSPISSNFPPPAYAKTLLTHIVSTSTSFIICTWTVNVARESATIIIISLSSPDNRLFYTLTCAAQFLAIDSARVRWRQISAILHPRVIRCAFRARTVRSRCRSDEEVFCHFITSLVFLIIKAKETKSMKVKNWTGELTRWGREVVAQGRWPNSLAENA